MHYVSHWLKRASALSLVLLLSAASGPQAQMRPTANGPTDVSGLWEKDDGRLCVNIDAQNKCTWEATGCGGPLPKDCTLSVSQQVEINLDGSRSLVVTRRGNNLEGHETGGGDVLLILQQCVCPYH
jgi:hypothetical protein